MPPVKKLSPIIIALIVIVLVGAGTGAVVVANKAKNQAASDTVQTAQATATTTTQSTDTSVMYKDGTYSEKGRYISPGGAESIDVTITLANNIITAATVTGAATDDSQEYQDAFISGYKSSVVGKDVHTVSLSRVAGSSLTSNGFNAALKLIKADAQA